MWRIFRGFNNGQDLHEDEDYQPGLNSELMDIACTWAKIRLGHIPYELDEFRAAIKAVQLYYLDNVSDNKVIGKGPWTLPAVHLLNGHLKEREFTPIAFSPFEDEDERVERDERQAHSTQIWVIHEGDHSRTRMRAHVENRPHVIRELQRIVNEVDGGDPQLATDVGPPPPGAPQVEEDGSARKRARLMDLSKN